MKKIVLLLVLVLSLTACSGKNKEKEEVKTNETEVKPEEKEEVPEPEEEQPVVNVQSTSITSIYSGREVTKEVQKARPVMLTIDNHPAARQQASLSKASIIWEMRVEGPYTRYLALFERPAKDENFLVGPIRSARPYFITLVNQYGGIFGHVGASKDGYKLIDELGLKDFDGFKGKANFFFRYTSTGKKAPNNLYSEIQDLFNKAAGKGLTLTNNGRGFIFNETDIVPTEGEDANEVRIVYSKKDASIRYEYDPETKSYLRFREGKQMLDENTREPIMAKNIIVQYADSKIYNGTHREIKSTGKGKGYYITAGKMQEIKWNKFDDHINPTKFTYEDGSEIKLNPGQTWIQVIDEKMKVRVK